MRISSSCLIAGLFLCFLLTSAEAAMIRREEIQFKQGAPQNVVKGRIKGRETVDYIFRAHSGQALSVSFKPGNRSAYFNVLPPNSDEAIFIGSSSGDHFETRLPADGIYKIRVYLMRNAARRNETARYELKVSISDTTPASGLLFDRTLEFQGLRFKITGENSGASTTMRIVPSGLEIDNSPVEMKIAGTIKGAEVADINADGSPEIYVYVTSTDKGSFGSLVAFSANRRKSLSGIYLPPFTDNKALSAGYRGHDEFAVLEGVIGRRFPVYRDTDTDDKPTGGMRQLQYKLIPGEAGWLLTLDRTVEY